MAMIVYIVHLLGKIFFPCNWPMSRHEFDCAVKKERSCACLMLHRGVVSTIHVRKVQESSQISLSV